jgi:hypothetical protein
MNGQSRRAPPAELSAAQAEALRILLESELRAAVGAARESGRSRAAVDAAIEERGRRLSESVRDPSDPA